MASSETRPLLPKFSACSAALSARCNARNHKTKGDPDALSPSDVGLAPAQQDMSAEAWPTRQDITAMQLSLEQKEGELHAAQALLTSREATLAQHLSQGSNWGPAAADCASKGSDKGVVDSTAAAGAAWSSMAHDKALLSARWQCLVEEKRQLTALMQLAAAGRVQDFEPGETPMRDVTCAVITHQLDTPCFSCCFQR